MNCGTAYIYGDLNTQVTYIVGQIIIWPNSSNLPPGFLSCNGTEISRTTYKLLFDEIGTKFGTGDGSTTFSLPLLNNMDTSNFSLAKGDNNMISSSNTLNTISTNLNGGGNTINATISHGHNINSTKNGHNINSTKPYNINAINYNANANDQWKRALKTENANTIPSGAKNTDYYVEKDHTHNITFNTNSTNYNFNASENITQTINTTTSGSQSSVIPLSLKVHYLIYSGVNIIGY